MRIESGLEEMRISSISNEDEIVDRNGSGVSIEEGESEDKASPDASHPKDQIPNLYNKNGDIDVDKHVNGLPPEQRDLKSEAMPNRTNSISRRFAHAGLQINADGIYLDLIKPSKTLIANLNNVTPALQGQIALVILDCCNMGCYNFYETYELWIVRSGESGPSSMRPLFQRHGELRYPTDFRFFEFHEWVHRVRSFLIIPNSDGRLFFDNSPRLTAGGFEGIARIPRIMRPLGGADVSVAEESLVHARNFCNHLRHWECASWLKALHMTLLEPDVPAEWYSNFIHRWTRYRDSILQRQPRGPKVLSIPPHATAAVTPRKRARMDDDTADKRSENVSPIQSPVEEPNSMDEGNAEE